MKLVAVLAVLTIALCGCNESKVVVPDIPASNSPSVPNSEILPGPKSTATSVAADKEKAEVGDVEAKVDLELTMEGESTLSQSVEELRNAKKKLNFLTISASGPRPAEVWIKIDLKTVDSFATRPSVVRGKVYREITKGNREELFSFQTVLDGFAAKNYRKEGGTYYPIEFRAEILHGLAALPESMLIFAEAEVFMSPTGTDPAMIDPATYTTGPEDTGHLLSNPVRFNYNPIPALPAPTPSLESTLKNPLGVPAAPAVPASAPAEAAPAPAEAPTATPAPETPVNTAPATEAVGAAK